MRSQVGFDGARVLGASSVVASTEWFRALVLTPNVGAVKPRHHPKSMLVRLLQDPYLGLSRVKEGKHTRHTDREPCASQTLFAPNSIP